MVGGTEKSSHADASSESETMGMRREGRGWCTDIGVRMVISGVDNGDDEDEEESDDAYGDTVLVYGSDFWYSVDDVVAEDGKVNAGDDNGAAGVGQMRLGMLGWKLGSDTCSL